MASGTATRRKRAAQRVPAPPVAATPRAVGRRWLLAGLAAAIVIAVGLGFVLARGDGNTVPDGATLPDAAEAAAIFHGVPQQGVALGSSDAPVTIVEFVDLQCPFCRQFEVETMPTLVEKYIRTSKARLEIRGLSFLGPDSERGLRAVLAASRQDRMFELAQLLYFNQGAENSGWLNDDIVAAAARSTPGLDAARLGGDMDSDAVSALLEEHAAEAERLGIKSTPTVLVGPTGGSLKQVVLGSPRDIGAIEQAIAAA